MSHRIIIPKENISDYSSYIALRNVVDIYAALLANNVKLSEPYIKIYHDNDGRRINDYKGYSLTFRKINDDPMLIIKSGAIFGGITVEFFNKTGKTTTYDFNNVLRGETFESIILSLAEQIKYNNEVGIELFSKDRLLENIKDLRHDVDLNDKNKPTYSEHMHLCLTRLLSFYALYDYYGGHKIAPWIAEHFDSESKNGVFEGFSADFYVGNRHIENESFIIFNGESTISTSDEGSWCFYVYLYDMNNPNKKYGDIDYGVDAQTPYDADDFVYFTKKIVKDFNALKDDNVFTYSRGQGNIELLLELD